MDEVLTFPLGISPKISPSKKRRKGRPRKAAQVEQQIETDAEVEHSQSPSVDVDASMPDVEIEDNSTDAFAPSAKETTIDEVIDETEELQDESRKIVPGTDDISGAHEDTSMAATEEESLNISPTAEESIDEATGTSVASEVRPTSPDIERIGETIINEGTFQDESSPAPESVESKNDPSEEVVPATSPDHINSPSAEPVELQNDPLAEIVSATSSDLVTSPSGEPAEEHSSVDAVLEAEPELPTVQSMKNKLQSLIADMQSAALSREELRGFEDLFDDAKEQLYGAGRRGRALGT